MENNTKKMGILFIVFSFICFYTSCYFDSTQSKITQILPPEGDIVGPIEVEKDKTVYEITVKQQINRNGDWSHVSGELLDKNKEYLLGFGDEFWSESGYDDEGHWSESKNSYDSKITIPEKGQYYFKFVAEKSSKVKSNIEVIIEQKRASALPSFVMGIISLLIGVFLSWKSMLK